MDTTTNISIADLLNDPEIRKEIEKHIRENKISTPRVAKSGIWREEKNDKWGNFTGYKMIYVVKGVRKVVSFNQNNMSRADLAAMVDTEILRIAKKYRLEVEVSE